MLIPELRSIVKSYLFCVAAFEFYDGNRLKVIKREILCCAKNAAVGLHELRDVVDANMRYKHGWIALYRGRCINGRIVLPVDGSGYIQIAPSTKTCIILRHVRRKNKIYYNIGPRPYVTTDEVDRYLQQYGITYFHRWHGTPVIVTPRSIMHH